MAEQREQPCALVDPVYACGLTCTNAGHAASSVADNPDSVF